MRFLGGIILFIVLFTIAAPIFRAVSLDVSDFARFWLTAAVLGLGFWLTRKWEPEGKVSVPSLPRLEVLERRKAAITALKWPPVHSARPNSKGNPAHGIPEVSRQDNAALIEAARVRRERLERE